MASKLHTLTTNPLGYIYTQYDYLRTSEDHRTKDWPLTQTPWIPLSYMMAYFFIVWVGPKLMANRKPISLGHALTVYNFALVGLSAYMVYEFFMSAFLASYTLGCQDIDRGDNPLAIRMANVCWVYYISKYIEVADTIFFILRKKSNQITFLHVYHHGTMIFNWWLCIKYIPGGATFFHAMLNSFVHVVMYSYYGLAACGPAIQPFLWWKKYVTKIQLIQFLVVLAHSVWITTMCNFPQIFTHLSVFYAVTMIVLFSNFYYREFFQRAKLRAAKQMDKKST